MDPITIALIAKSVISGAKAIQGASQRKKAKKLEEEVMSKGMPRLQTPAEYYELYKASQRDKAMEAEIAQAQQIQASNIEALQTGGSRAMLGGAPAVVAATQANVAEAARRGYQREQKALSALAAANARTQGINFQADLNERNRQLKQAAIAYQAGTETLYSGLDEVASSATLGADEFDWVNKLTAEGTSPEIATPESPFVTNQKNGGPITTKGDFDHESNPLHVVDNDGQKVAEVTGQETLVYNPKQRQLMKKIMDRLISKGKVSLNEEEKREAKEVLKAFQK